MHMGTRITLDFELGGPQLAATFCRRGMLEHPEVDGLNGKSSSE